MMETEQSDRKKGRSMRYYDKRRLDMLMYKFTRCLPIKL